MAQPNFQYEKRQKELAKKKKKEEKLQRKSANKGISADDTPEESLANPAITPSEDNQIAE